MRLPERSVSITADGVDVKLKNMDDEKYVGVVKRVCVKTFVSGVPWNCLTNIGLVALFTK